MAFDSLTEKLQNVFRNLRSKGRLTEDDVKAALKEVKMALLEADVNFKVVKGFIKDVQERAVGQDVMNGLNPGQMVIKIVNEELIKLMGSETTEIKLQPGSAMTVIMMAGLQGAGKTTTTAKLAGKFKLKGKKPLLVACDVYRPAAIKQLQINGEKQGVEVFSMGDKNSPVDIAKAAVEHARQNGQNVVILDTAGRLHIDEEMMEELIHIKVLFLDIKHHFGVRHVDDRHSWIAGLINRIIGNGLFQFWTVLSENNENFVIAGTEIQPCVFMVGRCVSERNAVDTIQPQVNTHRRIVIDEQRSRSSQCAGNFIGVSRRIGIRIVSDVNSGKYRRRREIGQIGFVVIVTHQYQRKIVRR